MDPIQPINPGSTAIPVERLERISRERDRPPRERQAPRRQTPAPPGSDEQDEDEGEGHRVDIRV